MLKIDLHIHSINSGHGFGTFYEIAAEAYRKKMSMIAITDHGPAMAGTTSTISLWMGSRAPKSLYGVRILWGCEANIIDVDGGLDVSPELQEKTDLLLVGLHAFCNYPDQGFEGNTIAFNDGCGVGVTQPGTERNQIRGNSIHSNGGKGIENLACEAVAFATISIRRNERVCHKGDHIRIVRL